MEAVRRVAAKVPVQVQGAVGDESSTSRMVGVPRCCNVRLARIGSGLYAAATGLIGDGLKLERRIKSYGSVQWQLRSSSVPSSASVRGTRRAVQPKSEKRVMDDADDAFACSTAHGTVGSISSSADAQDEDCRDSPTAAHGIRNLHPEKVTSSERSPIVSGRSSLFLTGAAALMASLEVQGVIVMQAVASESNLGNTQAPATDAASTAVSAVSAVSAASRAPSWLASAVVAFPICSYFLFGLYRDKINPSAKVTDWLFTLVAVGIVANILLQVTWGVRLY